MATNKVYDVLVIGGGPAGLAMATSLARQLYTTLIIDSEVYRNTRATNMHNVPGFDHVPPPEFRAKARADLLNRYQTVEFKKASIKEVRKLDSGVFEAVDERGGVFWGRKLGLATGMRDRTDDQPEGYEECWARGIFHCLFCHGFEERGAESVGVLAGGLTNTPETLTHVAPMAARLSKSVTIYTNGNDSIASAIKANLHSSKFHYDSRKITRFSLINGGPEVQITFDDGSTKTEGFLVNHPSIVQSAPFADQLGLERLPGGEIKVEAPMNETSVEGCYAAGDNASPMKSVLTGMSQGMVAAAGMAMTLMRELDAKDEL